MQLYNHRKNVLGRLLKKATESEYEIKTSAHLLLSYVEAFVCRFPFPVPLFNVGLSTRKESLLKLNIETGEGRKVKSK